MIYRSEFGPCCTHCGRVNPASVVPRATPGPIDCFHCRKSFSFWIERLPFFCTDTKAGVEPIAEAAAAEPNSDDPDGDEAG
jgi:hypothetical protein